MVFRFYFAAVTIAVVTNLMSEPGEPPTTIEQVKEELAPPVATEAAPAAPAEEPAAEAPAGATEGLAEVEQLMKAAADKAHKIEQVEAKAAPPAPPGEPPVQSLPPGWVEATDPRYNNATYWFHEDTKETTWTRPTLSAPLPPTMPPPLPPAPPPASNYAPMEPAAPDQCQYGEKDPTIEAKLDEWVRAKRAKDYATSDRIREELRGLGSHGQGVDPDVERPNKQRRVQLGQGFDMSLDEEQQLVRGLQPGEGRGSGARGSGGGNQGRGAEGVGRTAQRGRPPGADGRAGAAREG